jgi:iron(III) transport system permease protein
MTGGTLSERVSLEVVTRPAAGATPATGFNRWSAAALCVSGLVTVPLAAVVWLALFPTDDIWSHLAGTVLPNYLKTTVLLMALVALATLLIGVTSGWLTTLCDFPGRRMFEWALLLPLAVPAYVAAYIYTDLLEFAGPVQGALRAWFGWTSRQDYWFPEIRSVPGAAAMLTLVLYPYVYLMARAAFLEQSICVLEVSRTLGRGAWGSFWGVALPLARPAIVVGVSLVMMETLNDFGTVQHFAVSTLTAGVYDVWLNMSSTAGAAQLSLVMLALVLVLITMERLGRRSRRFHHTTNRWRPLPRHQLRGITAVLACVACGLPIVLGFAIPAVALIDYTLRPVAFHRFEGQFGVYLWNSLTLSSVAALLAVATGLLLCYAVRLGGGPIVTAAGRVASAGYALPGAVLAVGIVVPFAHFDNALDRLLRDSIGVSTGLLLSGSLAALVFGYTVRFLALAQGACEAGLAKITPGMDGAARSLGLAPGSMLLRIHLPMLRTSLLTAAILVFVDGMKELPMTVLLRPFNFDTLATHVYQYASHDQFQQSAPGALAIVAFGMLPVYLLSRTISASRPERRD